MKHFRIWFAGFAIVLATPVTFWSCDDGAESAGDKFDRSGMLQNMADNIILPQFTTLQSRVSVLSATAETFTANTTAENLGALQTAWINAYKAWQFTNAFNFGPGGEQGLKKGLIEEAGTFPADEVTIESKIENNDTNLTDANRDARGFLALEYLIFRVDNNNNEVLADFESPKRKAYLTALVNNLKSQIDAVITGWATYQTEFISNDGTSVGSSTSMLYNEFVRSFESIKNFKVGLPMGLRPGQVETEPQLVEAYYSGNSITMLKEQLTSIENIWHGKSKEGVDGIGFKEYLESVTGGEALIASTELQLAEVKEALNALPTDERLSQQVNDNANDVEAFYVELQKHTRYFKSDMSSLLGIAITFSSSDGD